MNPAQYDDLGPMQRDILGELRRRYDTDTAEAALAALREEIAHELAEKIRNAPGWVHGEWMDSRDRDFAADLIDPEAVE